jgi:hypothetical protein
MNNNAIINNYYARFYGLIFSSKLPWARKRLFFEIYRKFGHASSKRLPSPALDCRFSGLNGRNFSNG